MNSTVYYDVEQDQVKCAYDGTPTEVIGTQRVGCPTCGCITGRDEVWAVYYTAIRTRLAQELLQAEIDEGLAKLRASAVQKANAERKAAEKAAKKAVAEREEGLNRIRKELATPTYVKIARAVGNRVVGKKATKAIGAVLSYVAANLS